MKYMLALSYHNTTCGLELLVTAYAFTNQTIILGYIFGTNFSHFDIGYSNCITTILIWFLWLIFDTNILSYIWLILIAHHIFGALLALYLVLKTCLIFQLLFLIKPMLIHFSMLTHTAYKLQSVLLKRCLGHSLKHEINQIVFNFLTSLIVVYCSVIKGSFYVNVIVSVILILNSLV